MDFTDLGIYFTR